MSCALQPSAAQGSKRREGLRLLLDGTRTRAGWKTKSGDSCRLRGTQGLLLLLPLPFDQRGCSSFRASADIPSGYLDCIGAPGASHHLVGWNRLLLICYQSELSRGASLSRPGSAKAGIQGPSSCSAGRCLDGKLTRWLVPAVRELAVSCQMTRGFHGRQSPGFRQGSPTSPSTAASWSSWHRCGRKS